MSGWQNPSVEPAIAALNIDISFLLLGVYGWEYVQSLDVEYAVIRGRLSFRWPLIPYIVGRTCLLIFLILLAVGTGPFSQGILCLPSVVMTSLSGDIALGCSSTIFVIRAWLIWKDSRWVHALLSIFSLGQWTLLVFDATTMRTTDENGICDVYLQYPRTNAAVLIFITCYDLFVFVLSVVGLSRQRSSQTPLKKHLRGQGILYLALVVMIYIPPSVTALLNMSSVLIIFSNIAITASTIASCRAVRSLLTFDTSTPGQTSESNHDIALTTQIVIRPSISHDGTILDGRFYPSDEASKC